MPDYALQPAEWTHAAAVRLVKAKIRLHNLDALNDDMAAIFVVGRFTRLEALLLPYALRKYAGSDVSSLVPGSLFQGRIGAFLKSTATTSAEEPVQDGTFIRTVLTGEHPWIVFPKRAMVEREQADSSQDGFQAHYAQAATLALRAEFHRRELEALGRDPAQAQSALEQLGLETVGPVLRKRTVIIPINITYFPLRAHGNPFLRLTRALAKDPNPRALDNVSVQGTVLASDTDIDITLGTPIGVRPYLDELVVHPPGGLEALESDPKSALNRAVRRLAGVCATVAAQHATLNCEHILATLLRQRRPRRYTGRALRHKAFLCSREIATLPGLHLHPAFGQDIRALMYGEATPRFDGLINLCVREKVIQRKDDLYSRSPRSRLSSKGPQGVIHAIASELEPIAHVTRAIRKVALTPRFIIAGRVRRLLIEEDLRLFREDYATYYEEGMSKSRGVGKPFFLCPSFWVRGGVILIHGYMAAPLEIRALAEFLYRRGYAVYGVRLAGHGTSPADLARTHWEDWYQSIHRAYGVIGTLTSNVILGGFSMGAGLALLAAARKRPAPRACFAINAPMKLSGSAWLAPSVVRFNTLLKRLKWGRPRWDYVANEPENEHINYTSNPVTGVAELIELMGVVGQELKDITAPTLVLHGSRDPVVHHESGQAIFEAIGTPHKELTLFERGRHGIVNGPGATDIFQRVHQFLQWAPTA